MNRRRFLSLIATGAAVATATPLMKFVPPPEAVWKDLSVEVVNAPMPVVPEAVIGAWASYRFHMTVSMPPDTHHRIRYIRYIPCEDAIS